MKNWIKEDFYAFVLLYCANADFNTSGIELNAIKDRISRERFDEIYSVFESQNDYQNIQTINTKMDELDLSKEDVNGLTSEMLQLFFADGDFSQTEQNLMIGLKKILG